MTTETIATADAESAAPETTLDDADAGQGSETADEAGPETQGSDTGSDADEAEADKVQTEVDKATRKARRRIDRLIAERAQRDERLTQLEAELAEAKAAKDQDKPKTEDPREIAATMRLVEKTADATSKVMREAGKKFSDFEAAVAELVEELGPQIDKAGRPTPLMEAVLDSDIAADVLYHLGKNPEEAAELVGLSPSKLGRRIALLEKELEAKAKPKQSAAPKPLAPVKASAPVTVDETKMTDAQWRAWRLKAKSAA